MPQLNPTPWFTTFLISWIILLVLIHPKLVSTHLPNEPTSIPDMGLNQPWTWPWS